jgi:transposase
LKSFNDDVFRITAVVFSPKPVGKRDPLAGLTWRNVRIIIVSAMYLRTIKRKNKNGTVTKYYQLAHNERDPKSKKPVANIIHNFGRAAQLDIESLTRLSKSIARVCGLKVTELADEPGDTEEIKRVKKMFDVVRIIRTVEIGPIQAIRGLWERLGIGEILRALDSQKGCQIPYEQALLAMTANRLCEPESKLGVWDRWLSKIYLPTCDTLTLDNMYDAMDRLHAHAESVERNIFFHTANLFNQEVDLIFYDTTTASFHIDQEDEDIELDVEGKTEILEKGLRKYGHAKEGNWTPQVVVALAVTREGLPVRCWVFPGNTSDVSTVKRVRDDLRSWKLGRALFVADSGMNSEKNREELARACGKYLLACRMASVGEIKQEVLSSKGKYKVLQDNLHAREVIVGDGERRRRYILCYNPKEAERQLNHRLELVAKLEEMLGHHRENNCTAQWAIELLASRRFKRYLKITQDNRVEIDREAIKEVEKYDGKWVIETNDDTISFEDAACGYKSLMVIEQCFRSLKRTQIKMMPMYHWAPRRIETHVRICVLALLIQRVAEISCQMPWSKIRNILAQLQVTECQTLDHVFFKLNEVSKEVKEVFEKLDIPLPQKIIGIIPMPKSKYSL